MKEFDRLTRDVLAAEAAGYGPWYGRFIADHGHTAADEPVQQKAPAKTAICPLCGNEFIQKPKWPQKYCGAECRERARYINHEAYKKRKAAACAAPPE